METTTPSTEELLAEIDELRNLQNNLLQSGSELVSAQTKLQSLLHSCSDAVIQFYADGTVQSFNTAAERIFGYQEIKILGSPINHLFKHTNNQNSDVPNFINQYVESNADPAAATNMPIPIPSAISVTPNTLDPP